MYKEELQTTKDLLSEKTSRLRTVECDSQTLKEELLRLKGTLERKDDSLRS